MGALKKKTSGCSNGRCRGKFGWLPNTLVTFLMIYICYTCDKPPRHGICSDVYISFCSCCKDEELIGHAVRMRNWLRLFRIALLTDRIVYMVSASGCKVGNHFHTNNLNGFAVVCCVFVPTAKLIVSRFYSRVFKRHIGMVLVFDYCNIFDTMFVSFETWNFMMVTVYLWYFVYFCL